MQYLVRTNRFCMWAVKPGDRAAGDAAGREALPPVAGRPEGSASAHRGSSRDGRRTPGCPRSSSPRDNRREPRVVTGIVLGRLVVPEVIANIRTSVPVAEEGVRVALAHAIDVRLVPIVAADRHALAEIGRRADLAERNGRGRTGCRRAARAGSRAARAERRRRSASGRETPAPAAALA